VIKASAKGPDGRDMLVIGLSYGNLDEFRAHPRDTFIRISGHEMGLATDVMIFSGETEASCADMIQQFMGPKTKTTVDERLKN
jgi:hypothetical protein